MKEGANARMRHGYREVLSISQAGSVPDNELSLKVPLPCESGSWAKRRGLSELSDCFRFLLICGASDSDEVIDYWRVYLDASELK